MNKTTKILFSSTLCALILVSAGCKKAEEIRTKVIDDTKKTYDSANKKVNEIKDATTQKINDIEDAAKKIKDASDAIQKVTNDETATPTAPQKK